MAGRRDAGGFLGDAAIVAGLLAVQCAMAAYVVLTNLVLALGADPLALVALTGAVGAAVFLPFAVFLERKKWPGKMSMMLMGKFLLISLGGCTLFQVLMLLGIERTSPAVVSAMPNLAPGLIFLIAACLRMERFDVRCNYTRAKIAGTVTCLTGVALMSFLQHPPSVAPRLLKSSGGQDWTAGCIYLFGGVVVLSFNTVLQAATLAAGFPAPLTLYVITSAIGAMFTAGLEVVMEGRFTVGMMDVGIIPLAGIVLMGGAGLGACNAFLTWCIAKKGPVMVSIFSPVQTLFAAIFSMLLLGQTVSSISLVGVGLMFCGLYMVLWAKRNELGPVLPADFTITSVAEDLEAPLIFGVFQANRRLVEMLP